MQARQANQHEREQHASQSPSPSPLSPTPPPTQQWSSGRVLSVEQRQRKRQVNRETARRNKNDYQARIAELEKRVAELESWRAQANLQDQPFMGSQQPGEVRQSQPSEHGRQDPNIIDMAADLNAYMATPGSNLVFSADSIPEPHDLNWSDCHPILGDQLGQSTTAETQHAMMEQLIATSRNETWGPAGPGEGSFLFESVAPAKVTRLQAEDLTSLKQNTRLDGREITQACNMAVAEVRNLNLQDVCLDDVRNQDILVRAVVEGWDAALKRFPRPCPIWQVLRNVDLLLFDQCPMKERLCLLRIIHLMDLYEVGARVPSGKDSLPWWYRPRPSQQHFAHEPVIDHLAWPGLRERLTISENNLLTNRYWKLFSNNFRFMSSEGPLDIVRARPGTPFYQLSDDFKSGIHDIGRYRMAPAFFTAFPHLRDDIGMAEFPLLSLLTLPLPTSEQRQYPLEELDE